MATERLEPFRQALLDLRSRLRDGRLEPGARVTAKDVAEGLKLSPTPVREALSRLAGEGVLEERRGDGFFVPELSAVDIVALYRLNEHLLLISQGAVGAARRDAVPPDHQPGDGPIRLVERLFLAWIREANSRVILDAYRTTALRLAPVRRREMEVIPDLEGEARILLELAGPGQRRRRPAAIQAFHRRRVALAEAMARALERASPQGD